MLMKKRLEMMLALWRCWHQFQLFLVLQIRLLLNWFCPPLLGRLIDCKCLRQQRLNQGWASRWNIWHLRRIFYLEEICSFWGYFFLYLEEICSLLGCVLDLEDICFFLGYFSLFAGYMLLFGIFFLYLEVIYAPFGDIFSLFGGDICSRLSGIEICHLRRSRGGNALLTQK